MALFASELGFVIHTLCSRTAVQQEGWTPLFWATVRGQLDAVKYLIHQVCRRAISGLQFSIMTCVRIMSGGAFGESLYPCLSICLALLLKGADVETKASQDWTTLHFAALNGDVEMVSLLLDSGAEPTAANAVRMVVVSACCLTILLTCGIGRCVCSLVPLLNRLLLMSMWHPFWRNDSYLNRQYHATIHH